MHELKQISKEAIPHALEKAERYRLIDDPGQAESICLDILEVEPDNHAAEIMLILALTDQLKYRLEAFPEAKERIKALEDPYERAYYLGVLRERRARVHYRAKTAGSGFVAYEWFMRALESFAEAEKLRPEGNDDALYRWNAVARTLNRSQYLQPAPHDPTPLLME